MASERGAAATSNVRDKPLHHRDVISNVGNELMEVEESEQDLEQNEHKMSHSDNSDTSSDDDNDDENDPGNFNHPLLLPPPGNIGFPHGIGARGRPPWGPRQLPGLGGGDSDDEMFEGEGHRLGGKDVAPMVGDLLISNQRMQASGTYMY